MVTEYARPAGIDEALDLLASPEAFALAGGTAALAFEGRYAKNRAVDIGKLLPKGVRWQGAALYVGAGTTFQEIIEAPEAPAALKAAAATMVNRNTRNRATVGGNIAAAKSCSSFAPLFLALGAAVEYQERGKAPATKPLSEWLDAPAGMVLSLRAAIEPGTMVATGRASRTAADVAIATAACAFRLDGGRLAALHVAVGGFSAHAAARADIAALFEGKPLPSKADLEKAVAPLLHAIADQRGSADFKRVRGAALVADVMHAAAAGLAGIAGAAEAAGAAGAGNKGALS